MAELASAPYEKLPRPLPRGARESNLLYALWGATGQAKVLSTLIAQRGGRVVALFDQRDIPSPLPGVPLHIGMPAFERWAAELPTPADVTALAAIGGDRGRDRLAVHALFRRFGLRIDSLVHADASVCASATLGAGCQVLAQAVVAAEATLGEACIVNHRASVDHDCVLGAGVHIAPGATLCGNVTVGEGAMVGAGAVVLPRLNIGAGSVVGAGAVVTRDVPAGVVVAGNPARVLRSC